MKDEHIIFSLITLLYIFLEAHFAKKLLLSFSIKKNFKKLPHANDSCPPLKILYGVRVFSICMIIMDHRFGTYLSSAVMNFNLVEEVRLQLYAQFCWYAAIKAKRILFLQNLWKFFTHQIIKSSWFEILPHMTTC